MLTIAALSLTAPTDGGRRRSELLPRAEVEKMGVVWRGNATTGPNSRDMLPEPNDCA